MYFFLHIEILLTTDLISGIIPKTDFETRDVELQRCLLNWFWYAVL